MDAHAGLFSSVWAYFIGGGAMAVLGGALLLFARRAAPASRKSLRLIGWPLLGCGGCLLAAPVAVVAFLGGFGWLVVTFCADKPGC